jgi:hypothetical protein
MAILATALAALTVSFAAPNHTPKINTHWPYAVHATRAGKPVRARLTMQIVDPLGGVHPVKYKNSAKGVTNWPIDGVFRDFMVFPAASNGIPLKVRTIVVAGSTRRVLVTAITPHG